MKLNKPLISINKHVFILMLLCGMQLSLAEDKTAEENLFEKVKKIGQIKTHYEGGKEKFVIPNYAVFKSEMYSK